MRSRQIGPEPVIRDGIRPSPPRVRADWIRPPDGRGGAISEGARIVLIAELIATIALTLSTAAIAAVVAHAY